MDVEDDVSRVALERSATNQPFWVGVREGRRPALSTARPAVAKTCTSVWTLARVAEGEEDSPAREAGVRKPAASKSISSSSHDTPACPCSGLDHQWDERYSWRATMKVVTS